MGLDAVLIASQGAQESSPEPTLGIGILGPVLVKVDGDPVELSRLLERALLARLALAVGEGVSCQRLVDDIWGESPPRDGLGSLQTLVYRLRQTLGAAASSILTTQNGYALDAPGDAVDEKRFLHLVAEARKSHESSSGGVRRDLLGQALALWRGPALGGLEDIPFAPSCRTQLNAIRMSVLKERIEADLVVGLDAEIVPELEGLVSEHPFEEHLWVQLMLAQYRSGSQADALHSYERLRQILVEELGIEPGPAAKSLEQSILHHDEVLILKKPALRAAEATLPRDRRLITLLVADLESRSGLWKSSSSAVAGALRRCEALVVDVVACHGGEVVSQIDGAACAAFEEPSKALLAALDLQRALLNERWDEIESLLITMAVHTGNIEVHDGQLFGPALHTTASLVRAGHGGQVLVSAAAAELTRDGLPEGSELRDLGHWVLPDTARPVHAYELRHRDLPYAPQALRVGRPGTGTQPLVATTFVGREQELATLTALVAELPLVTLTGLGGVGKTRLAIEVARAVATTFPEEWWFCDLSAATSEDEVIERMATSLGLQARTPEELFVAVTDWLMLTPALFVVDNCEHVSGPVAAVIGAAVRKRCSARVLVTSRRALGMPEEHVVRVHPLRSAPIVGDGLNDVPPAVRLLFDRSRAAGATLALEDPALGRVVERVDGLPLAIELAARRLTSMTPDELVDRFDLCVDLLTGPAGPPRQRTMDSTMDWSFALLAPSAQKLFAALSVCSGGWTLEAAEALGESIGLVATEVPRIVADLWDQSLLTTDHSTPGQARYGMLTTVRTYASRKLDIDGMKTDVGARHAEFFAAFAIQVGDRPFGPDEGSRIRALEDQFDNVRAAFRWCLGTRDWDTGMSILVSLVPELVLRERIEVGRWASEVIGELGDEAHSIRGVALAISANTALVEGRLEDAKRLSLESIEAENQWGSPPLWLSRNALAIVSATAKRFEDMNEKFRDMVEMSATTGDPLPEAVSLFDRALLASFSRDPSRGVQPAEELIQLGDRWRSDSLRAMGLVSVGRTMGAREPERASAALHEAANLAEASRCSLLLQQARRTVIEIESSPRDREVALKKLTEILHDFGQSGDISQQLQTIVSALAPLAGADALDVATVLAAALSQTPFGSTPQCTRTLELARTRLPAEVFTAAFAHGSSLSPSQLIETATGRLADVLARPRAKA